MKFVLAGLVGLLTVSTGMSAFALTEQNDLPKNYSRVCGRVISIEKDKLGQTETKRILGVPTVDGRTPTWVMSIQPKPDLNFSVGISIDKKNFDDIELRELVKSSLGKNVCLDVYTQSHFWLESIQLKAE